MKKSQLQKYIKEEIIEILSEATPEDVEAQKELNKELEKTKELTKDLDLNEEEDAEPSDADLKKKDSVSTLSNKLQQTTTEMKQVVKKWKEAEGAEKDKLLSRLKELTKIKKELEGLL